MSQVATIAADDNFATAAAASSSTIVGERLRFNKGRYLIGKGDANPLPARTELQVLDVQTAWIKFVAGKVADQRIGWPIADREELDDYDEENWPFGPDGQRADPWVLQRMLYMVDPDNGAEYTFVTSSWGGRTSVDRLSHQIATKRRGAPGALPTVRLETRFQHSPKFGAVPAPSFVVVGWRGETPGNASLPVGGMPPNNGSSGSTAVLDMPRVGSAGDLDDEIPF
jgi:hypothetical protein